MKTAMKNNIIRVLIYVCVLISFIIKMNFYSDHFGYFNDELAHVSYVAYLEANDEIYPEFRNMTLLSNCDLNGKESTCTFNETLNWLGHPPLYYEVMRLMGGVSCDGDVITVDMHQLRTNTHILACIALGLAFFIGYKKIKRIVPTLVYAVMLVSVPMFSVVSAGLNNDTMSYICVLIYALGIMRFSEGKRDFGTYTLIAAGITMSGLTKLTTLIIIVVSALIVVGVTIFKEKSAKCIFNKKFIISLVFYIPVIIYYIMMLKNYGSVQFTATKYGYPAVFVPEDQRGIHGIFHYFIEYVNMYLITWCNVSSHYTVVKTQYLLSVENIGLMIMVVSPFVLFLFNRKNKNKLLFNSVFIGYVITMAINFVTCYSAYTSRGYFGGMHSRYYYCLLPVFSLWLCSIYGKTKKFLTNKLETYFSEKSISIGVDVALLVFASLLVYGDFLVFLKINTMYI